MDAIQEDRAAGWREHIARGQRIADEATLELIEIACAVRMDGHTWYDTRALLNQHEYPDELLDMHAETITYGLERRLLARHPAADCAHLVRVVRRPSTN